MEQGKMRNVVSGVLMGERIANEPTRKPESKLPMKGKMKIKKGRLTGIAAATGAVKNDRDSQNYQTQEARHGITGLDLLNPNSPVVFSTAPEVFKQKSHHDWRPGRVSSIRTVNEVGHDLPQELRKRHSIEKPPAQSNPFEKLGRLDETRTKAPITETDSVETAEVQLQRIANALLRAASNSAELKGRENESAEDAVIRIIQQYVRITAALRDAKGRLSTADKIRQDVHRSEIELRDAKAHILQLEAFYAQKLGQMKQTIDQLIYERNEEVSTHGAKLYQEKSSFQREKDDLKLMYEEQLSRVRDEALVQAKTITELETQIKQKGEKWSTATNRLHTDIATMGRHLAAERSEHEKHCIQAEEMFAKQLHQERAKYEEVIRTSRMQIAHLEKTAKDESAVQQQLAVKQDAARKDAEEDFVAQRQQDMKQFKEKLDFVRHELMNTEKQLTQAAREQEQQLVKKHHEELSQLHKTVREIEGRSTKESDQLRKRSENERAELERRMDELTALLEKAKLQIDNFESVSKRDRDTTIRRLQRQQKAECDQLRTEADVRLHKEQQKYEKIIKGMKSEFNEFIDLRNDVEKHRPKSLREIDALKVKLGDKHDLLNVRSANEGMKRILTTASARPKGLRDRDIVRNFKVIAEKIEVFSRLEWDINRESSWPCSESQMRQLYQQNTRKLKLQVIQSSLWTFLYERIFRSPFCMFGPEGTDMDRYWEDVYAPTNSPLKQPDVPLDIENKRCADAKQCLLLIDAVTDVSEDEPKLKTSYELVVATAVASFSRLVENVASVRELERASLDTIVRLCAKSWLEGCSQEYRLMVRLGAQGGNALALNAKAITHLWLVRTPELIRFGTLQGENLSSEETVVGWESGVYRYPA